VTPALSFLIGLATVGCVYALLALALDVQFGHTGLLNFGHVAFFGVGAFASAIVTLPPPGSPAYLESGA
jgi:branched-chain amino acid transport system permease protein